ncbi:MAG: PilZ domain-containing protein [Candidatus Firestonebacteria bacterium]
MPERRKFVRISVITEVSIMPLNTGAHLIKGVITNISATGIGIIAKESLEIDMPVSISFKMPDGPQFGELKGEIVRTQTIAEQHFAFVGVHFENLSEDNRAELNKYIVDLRHKQFGLRMSL